MQAGLYGHPGGRRPTRSLHGEKRDSEKGVTILMGTCSGGKKTRRRLPLRGTEQIGKAAATKGMGEVLPATRNRNGEKKRYKSGQSGQ